MPQPPVTTNPLPVIPDNRISPIQSPSQNLWRPDAKARDWKYIVIHHTASENGSVESIHETHLKKKDANGNAWLGIGYHFVIGNGKGMTDGEVEATFRWKQQIQGAHAGSADPVYNQRGIGICLIGNFENHPPSSQQLSALKGLVKTLKANYRISASNIIGHRDVRATECPGKLMPMDEIANIPVDTRFGEVPPAFVPAQVASPIEGIHP